MVQVVLPNDANPLGFILGGTVMHLIDIAGAIAAIATPAACWSPRRSTTCSSSPDQGRRPDHPEGARHLRVHDVARSGGGCLFGGDADGHAQLTSRAFLTFVAMARDGRARRVPPLLVETDEERRCRKPRAREVPSA